MKHALLSLLGKLVYLSKNIKPGRIFMCHPFNLTMSVKHLHYKVKLSRDAREDVVWWLNSASTWNRKSVFYDEDWSDSVKMEIYTDASDLGIGAVFKDEWFSVELSSAEKSMSIAWRELLAIVVACATWGEKLPGKKILLHCDNSAVVEIVNTGTCRCREIMCLVRGLFSICVKYNFDIKLQHIAGVSNIAADSLSRLDLGRFFRENPGMYSSRPTKIRRGCEF